MSELALSSPPEKYPNEKKKNKNGFSSLLISDFHLICSFIISHPFYFSYILFFSPYIFKILSFLSPLFITTTLLFLSLLSTLLFHDTESLETQPSFLFSFCTKLGSVLESKFELNDEDFKSLEELDAYKMVVEAFSMECSDETWENPVDEMCSYELAFVDKFCSHESTVSKALTLEIQPLKFENPMDLEREETKKCEKDEEIQQKVKPISDIFLDNGEGQSWKQPTIKESKAQKVDLVGYCNDESYDLPKLCEFFGEEKEQEVIDKEEEEDDVSLKSLKSMRKEKEWRRTLACKLFEERHNSDVGQGMDQLWETYETQTEKKQTEEEKKMKKNNKKKSIMMKTKSIEKKEVTVDEEEEDDDDGVDHQQLCCLQALKFSTGKMHLGIARPNLLKLSKAFKGFGKFYNANKHSKKSFKADE